MRWAIILVAGLLLLAIGVALAIFGPLTPIYYCAEPTTILSDGTVVPGTFTPAKYEILAPTIPNTLHLNFEGYYPLNITLQCPNGTIMRSWNNYSIIEDYTLSECGVWQVHITAPTTTYFRGNLYTTAPLTAHPAFIYASGALLLGSLTILYAKNKRKLQNEIKNVLFEQNIGGRWVFAAWLPIFALTVEAPYYIPSYPWLYSALIVLTVVAAASSLALVYIKLYIATNGIFIEAPFINLSKYHNINQIEEFEITKQKKQYWLLLRTIPNIRGKKEDYVTMFLQERVPLLLTIVVFGARLTGNTITFRPKSLENFKSIMTMLSIPQRKTEQA